ncbi:glycosyltransferase family protein [Jannaschia seohaensis]|uniref:GT2 family glycosyltransferase n=1 Tax=Jannaschia seohaensis TaxID=475081 RepID=A0A2Y9B2S1_9RHOB|nr:glycosyltransferase [Jannaschia seohaensis]PWJ12933.1 GT2 family glycosyltransferase [Jannaschia seohaensis]SSA50741.1 Glycosyltransferase, GT2 family [Jannaschia seohaensis]
METKSSTAETEVQPDTEIGLGNGLRVEWKPGAASAPVQVRPIEVDGQSGHLIRTAPGGGWVRLRLPIEAPETGVLGARILLRIDRKGATAGIKPFLAKTNLKTDSHRPFPGMLVRTVMLNCGSWHEVAGAYLHTGFTGRFRPSLVVDLPTASEITLMDVSIKQVSVPVSPEEHAALLSNDVHPLAHFAVRPAMSGPGACLARPAVYAVSVSLSPSNLSGWVLSDAAPSDLSWRELGGARRSGSVGTGEADLIFGGPRIADGLDIQFDPPLDDGAVLQLTAAGEESAPIWTGTPAGTGSGAPIEGVFDISAAQIRDGWLTVMGNVVHPIYPGMPVRLELICDDDVIAATVARAPIAERTSLDAERAFRFEFSAPIRPKQAEKLIWLRVASAPGLPRMHIALDRQDGSAKGRAPTLPVPAMPLYGSVTGQVDGFDTSVITGWAICPEEPDSQVELVLWRDGKPFSYCKTQNYRRDIQDLYGNAGFNGFEFELPPNASVMRETDFEIRPVCGIGLLSKAHLRTALPAGVVAPAVLEAPRTWTPGPAEPLALTGRISVIVLNLNGADLLDEMFASLPPEDLSGEIEWIVVDHSSTDTSREICERHAAEGADIRFLARRGNYSFSESNNYGAAQATGDILLFANNDLVFPKAFGARLRAYMRRSEIGALGVRLRDHIDDPRHQDLAIDQHLGVFLERRTTPQGWVRPYEARATEETRPTRKATRAIAATGAFMALRRADFEAVGGFDEDYSYGLEDIDLCLKVRTRLGLEVVCAGDIEIVHHRGFSRKKEKDAGLRRRRNNEIFTERWGGALRRMIKSSGLTDPSYITGSRPVFAFMVADVGDETSAGEYYTSLEMGRALQKILPCHVRYIPEPHWYDLSGIDVVVAMVNRFDISKGKNASPWLVTVNWMRQWFDRWAEDPSLHAYDYLFASSGPACEMLEAASGRPVHLLPIASSYDEFAEAEPKEDWRCDYAFTGSRFGPPREIEFQLDPTRVAGDGKVFGYNWEGTPFAELSEGPVAYSAIPRVYASTRVVLDDANIATKPWGSCNSRVFDAMASGALLLTNGELGVRELFGDLVPTFHDADSLTEQLDRWLSDEPARAARAAQMQDVIRTHHTYDVRARELVSRLTADAPVRIAIKCAAHYREREQWGDYHYAQSLAAALRRQGYVARVDCRESWYSGVSESDDAVIVLRGLLDYNPKRHQTNLLWLISHPNAVSIAELDQFDHVFVASQFHAETLAQLVPGKIDFMPQCTDTSRFYFDPDEINSCPDRNLYVANSRGVFRTPVRWAIQGELDLDIYGVGWQPFITDERHKGEVISNRVLGGFYASSRLVICDHWDDMRALGYVSNRVFDVLGAGGRLVVDSVRGLEDLVPLEYIEIFNNFEEFSAILRGPNHVDLDQRREIADWVARNHSFDARAAVLAEKIRQVMDLERDQAA